MAKKLTGFADAMSEALMGRPAQESQPPMNSPVVEETTPKKEDSKTPMGTPSEAPSNTKPFEELPAVTEDEMDEIVNRTLKKNDEKNSKVKRGRPKTSSDDVVTTSIYCSKELLQKIDVISNILGITRSAYITAALEKEVATKNDIYQSYVKMFGSMKIKN